MEVYALVGPSGTGKSHRAIPLAHELGVDLIIDDGLIIKGAQILGGSSAKRQPTQIGAIKAALFFSEDQVLQAKNVIKQYLPEKVLILATSVRMAEKIGQRVELPPIAKIINIEEIASSKEIRKARIERVQHSKHVIPASTLEVKKSFPDTLINPLKVFLKRQSTPGKRSWLEQSVVRPNFTGYGKLTITHGALVSIIARATEEVRGVKSAGKVHLTQQEERVIIELQPVLCYGYCLPEIGRQIQFNVKGRTEEMTGLVVGAVHILIKELVFARP